MRPSAIATALAPTVASAQWWAGAPNCAQSCLSSAFPGSNSTTSTTSVDWPSQTDYCDSDRGSDIGSCLSSSCSATSTAWSSYSSLSSSLCSQWSSCTSAGSTGVQTITCPSGSVTWGAPGGWPTRGSNEGRSDRGGGPGGWGWSGSGDGDYSVWSQWASAYSGSQTWTGGVITVTGCAGDGSPWYAGPGGGWNNRGGFNGWVGWGDGWSRGPTSTATVTYTTTASGGSTSVVIGLATVAAAVSGEITSMETLGTAAATATPNSAPRRVGGTGNECNIVTTMMGLGLGGILGIFLML
ncbi:hypothetical protein SCAR479_06932 [Seiridium cardinale]|uniref:Uncharacterized protein n=1 Tax=Seiridium cardinale TaxID=138064 RepID=A0ABR2XRV4_9PEZI